MSRYCSPAGAPPTILGVWTGHHATGQGGRADEDPGCTVMPGGEDGSGPLILTTLLRDFKASLHSFMKSILSSTSIGIQGNELVQKGASLLVCCDHASDRRGSAEQAFAAFDTALAADESLRPYLWQRGLAAFYAERFADGVEQFASNMSVNGSDVEEVVWHMLCKAKIDGIEGARASMLKLKGGDDRPWATNVLKLFSSGIEAVSLSSEQLSSLGSYMSFYVGIYLEEMLGDRASAEPFLKSAHDNPTNDYMGKLMVMHYHWFCTRDASADSTEQVPGAQGEGGEIHGVGSGGDGDRRGGGAVNGGVGIGRVGSGRGGNGHGGNGGDASLWLTIRPTSTLASSTSALIVEGLGPTQTPAPPPPSTSTCIVFYPHMDDRLLHFLPTMEQTRPRLRLRPLSSPGGGGSGSGSGSGSGGDNGGGSVGSDGSGSGSVAHDNSGSNDDDELKPTNFEYTLRQINSARPIHHLLERAIHDVHNDIINDTVLGKDSRTCHEGPETLEPNPLPSLSPNNNPPLRMSLPHAVFYHMLLGFRWCLVVIIWAMDLLNGVHVCVCVCVSPSNRFS